MDIFKLYATNIAQEEQGRDFTEEFGGKSTFKIARAGNRSYQRMVTKQFEAHRHILDQKNTPEEEEASDNLSFTLIGKIMAQTVLLGWSGEVEYDGESLPYSYDNAVKLLALKDFRAKILGLAQDFRNFLLAKQEADEKNSPPSSDGTSPGAPALMV